MHPRRDRLRSHDERVHAAEAFVLRLHTELRLCVGAGSLVNFFPRKSCGTTRIWNTRAI